MWMSHVRCVRWTSICERIRWTKMVVNYYRCEKWYGLNVTIVEYLQVAITFGRMKGFFYPILLARSVVFHSTFDPWNHPIWEKENVITHVPSSFVLCSNHCTEILDRCSPSYASMTVQVMEVICYDISWNPTRTITAGSMLQSRIITEATLLSVLDDHCTGIQLARKLT
jgi:hypothetical protein